MIAFISMLKADAKDLHDHVSNTVASVQWTDNLGDNLIEVIETDVSWNGDKRTKELYAYHYITNAGEKKQLWKVYDFIKDCEVDVTLNYIDGSLIVTDLNNDGISETIFMYRMSCKGDVSNDDMKLIMHEGSKKYAIRGSMNLIMNGQSLQQGSMKVDGAFDNAPESFLDLAKEQWNKFNTENIVN
ncbi:MAG: hypothetical protein ABI528_03175 [bacterium]